MLTGVITAPITRLELGFSPSPAWFTAQPVQEYSESLLFVRGDFAFASQELKFPMLAQT